MIDETLDEEQYESLKLWIAPSLLEEWAKFADLHGESIPETIRRLYRRAITGYARSREGGPTPQALRAGGAHEYWEGASTIIEGPYNLRDGLPVVAQNRGSVHSDTPRVSGNVAEVVGHRKRSRGIRPDDDRIRGIAPPTAERGLTVQVAGDCEELRGRVICRCRRDDEGKKSENRRERYE
jgi:hypothetical protein